MNQNAQTFTLEPILSEDLYCLEYEKGKLDLFIYIELITSLSYSFSFGISDQREEQNIENG